MQCGYYVYIAEKRWQEKKLLDWNFSTGINNIKSDAELVDMFVCEGYASFCRSGEYCQCDSERFSDINVDKCKSKNQSDGLTCSGNGECVCGVCQCNIIPVRYSWTKTLLPNSLNIYVTWCSS